MSAMLNEDLCDNTVEVSAESRNKQNSILKQMKAKPAKRNWGWGPKKNTAAYDIHDGTASSTSFLVRASATLHCLQLERAVTTLVVGLRTGQTGKIHEDESEHANRMEVWKQEMTHVRAQVDDAFSDMQDFSRREKPGLRSQFKSAQFVIESERIRVDQHAGSSADIFAVVSGLTVANTTVLDALKICLPSRADPDNAAVVNDLSFFLMFLRYKETAGVHRAHGVGVLAAGQHHGGTRESLLASLGALEAFAEACKVTAPLWINRSALDELLEPPSASVSLQAILLEPNHTKSLKRTTLNAELFLRLMTDWIGALRAFELQLGDGLLKLHASPSKVKVKAESLRAGVEDVQLAVVQCPEIDVSELEILTEVNRQRQWYVLHRAKWRNIDVSVKIKRNQMQRDLENEACVLRRLSHPNCIRMFTSFSQTLEGTQTSMCEGLVMEYMPGGTLLHFLEGSAPFVESKLAELRDAAAAAAEHGAINKTEQQGPSGNEGGRVTGAASAWGAFFQPIKSHTALRTQKIRSNSAGAANDQTAEGGSNTAADRSATGDLVRRLKAVIYVLESITRAMAYIHRLGLIHRDLAPQNILFTMRGTPKLADFNLACINGAEGGVHDAQKGTLRYTAPEVHVSTSYSFSADVFSFGIILWQLLAWEPQPYESCRGCFQSGKPYRAEVDIQAAKDIEQGMRPAVDDDVALAVSADSGAMELAALCWDTDVGKRPNFDTILERIREMDR